MKQSELNKLKTHCPRGHEYSPENTLHTLDGRGNACRICRTCGNLRRKEQRAREKDEERLTKGGAGAFKVRF